MGIGVCAAAVVSVGAGLGVGFGVGMGVGFCAGAGKGIVVGLHVPVVERRWMLSSTCGTYLHSVTYHFAECELLG